jgi:hypothetical protein
LSANSRILLLLSAGLLTPAAWAHPVAYQGATGVMVWNQPFLSDYWVTYSFRPDMAFAGRAMRMEMRDGGRSWFYGPQFDYLVHRWNEPDYQANVYAYGAFGGVWTSTRSGTAPLGGIEADAESRKYFIMGKIEGFAPTVGENFYTSSFRLGLAPYEAEFNEIATWLMVQAQHHPSLVKDYSVTPLVRLFYKNFLVEAGVSFDGDGMFNFMFHF